MVDYNGDPDLDVPTLPTLDEWREMQNAAVSEASRYVIRCLVSAVAYEPLACTWTRHTHHEVLLPGTTKSIGEYVARWATSQGYEYSYEYKTDFSRVTQRDETVLINTLSIPTTTHEAPETVEAPAKSSTFRRLVFGALGVVVFLVQLFLLASVFSSSCVSDAKSQTVATPVDQLRTITITALKGAPSKFDLRCVYSGDIITTYKFDQERIQSSTYPKTWVLSIMWAPEYCAVDVSCSGAVCYAYDLSKVIIEPHITTGAKQ